MCDSGRKRKPPYKYVGKKNPVKKFNNFLKVQSGLTHEYRTPKICRHKANSQPLADFRLHGPHKAHMKKAERGERNERKLCSKCWPGGGVWLQMHERYEALPGPFSSEEQKP